VSNYAASAPFARALAVACLATASLASFSFQATAAAAADEEDEELAEVLVTGTRIQLPNVTSANPVTTVTAEEMSRLGIVNVADALTLLVPQNISSYMPTLTGDNQAGFGGGGMETMDRGSFFIGNTIANLRGLDPTFGSRTLTLIDGRRVNSTSNQADVVDLNIIPSNLLERMDVVTGGASATYGSGAMAGVVNLVLNRRLTGVNLDMDYGVNEAGDGGSPHVSLSGGTPLFNGKGHLLVGAEWQDTSAIRNCAEARTWCAQSRAMLNNYTGFINDPSLNFTPLEGYEAFPARFQMANVRRSQFSPTGTIYVNNATVTSDYRFSADGRDLEEYALGFRGGTGRDSMNGDTYLDGSHSPLSTWGTVMRPSSERKSFFSNFEYDFTERTTAYVQASYARTDSVNLNTYTEGTACSRFQDAGVAAVPGATARAGDVVLGHPLGTAAVAVLWDDWAMGAPGNPLGGPPAAVNNNAPLIQWQESSGQQFQNANFRTWLGWSGPTVMGAPGFAAPYWVAGGANGSTYAASSGATQANPPTYTFENAIPHWIHVKNNPATNGQEWWVLAYITLTADFEDPGTPAVLPTMGRNAYAFLNNLTPEALLQLQSAFGTAGNVFGARVDQNTGTLLAGASSSTAGGSTGAGGGAFSGTDVLYGTTPCAGFTALRKVWSPQVNRWTDQVQEPWRMLVGLRGRFGGDWRWDTSIQYGKTVSRSVQHNVGTNLRQAMALDAVVDDRTNPDGTPYDPATYGTPVCRVTRDGLPVADYLGRPLSAREDLQALADGCQPLNVFGSTYSTNASFPGYESYAYDAAALQQAALDYAFVDSISSGWNDLANFDLNISGTVMDGIGAGPVSGAFGVSVSRNRVVNRATDPDASYYERADLSSAWSDGFGGTSTTSEAFTELNAPLVSGAEGMNLLSLNLGARYTSYHNKGAEGTTGESARQNVFNWKIQAVYEPFDWARLRVTRSVDQRAAGYRDLFILTQLIPDQFSGANPWREWNPDSNEGRQERWGQVRTGNPDLKPEKSNTLTLGLVLSPGGWAQGMRVSVDYYDIRVRDGITTPQTNTNPVNSCWTGSLNQDGSVSDPDREVRNGLIDYDYFDPTLQMFPCREITFGANPDGSVNLLDIISYNSTRPINGLPYQSRGVDVSWNYNFPLNRALESLPGSMSINLRGTRALEASGVQLVSPQARTGNAALTVAECAAVGGTRDADTNCYVPLDLVGQIRSSVFIPGVSATPKWVGNFSASYLLGGFTTTLSARYIGSSVLDKTWCDAGQAELGCPNYQDANGRFLAGSVDENNVKPYFNFSLNSSFDLKVGNLRQFQVFGSINNLFDKSPPFTGGGLSGASAQYHDTMGRSYRFGARVRF